MKHIATSPIYTYHLVMTNIAMENHHFYQVNRYKWAISHGYVR
jgi:hypothetical protein